MWDCFLIYVAIDFGCIKLCNESGMFLNIVEGVFFFRIGYYTNNGCVFFSPLVKVG